MPLWSGDQERLNYHLFNSFTLYWLHLLRILHDYQRELTYFVYVHCTTELMPFALFCLFLFSLGGGLKIWIRMECISAALITWPNVKRFDYNYHSAAITSSQSYCTIKRNVFLRQNSAELTITTHKTSILRFRLSFPFQYVYTLLAICLMHSMLLSARHFVAFQWLSAFKNTLLTLSQRRNEIYSGPFGCRKRTATFANSFIRTKKAAHNLQLLSNNNAKKIRIFCVCVVFLQKVDVKTWKIWKKKLFFLNSMRSRVITISHCFRE